MAFPKAVKNRKYKAADKTYIYDGEKWVYYDEVDEENEMEYLADIPLEVKTTQTTTLSFDGETVEGPLDGTQIIREGSVLAISMVNTGESYKNGSTEVTKVLTPINDGLGRGLKVKIKTTVTYYAKGIYMPEEPFAPDLRPGELYTKADEGTEVLLKSNTVFGKSSRAEIVEVDADTGEVLLAKITRPGRDQIAGHQAYQTARTDADGNTINAFTFSFVMQQVSDYGTTVSEATIEEFGYGYEVGDIVECVTTAGGYVVTQQIRIDAVSD